MASSSRHIDSIEQDFRNALQRLIDGKPENKKLKVCAKAGKLKVNTSNVALEAGHSRTLIAMDDCRYPSIRQEIKEVQGSAKKEPTTYTQLISNLRANVATLRAEKRLLETAMAGHVFARRRAEIDARRAEAAAENLRKQVSELEKISALPNRDVEIPRLVLIRGLPGSGKSKKAMKYVNDGYLNFEAEQFLSSEERYQCDAARLLQAQTSCLNQTRAALAAGEYVCVSNVFATLDEMRPYADLNVDYQVVEANYTGESKHPVSASAMRALQDDWVPTDLVVQILKSKSRTLARVTRLSSIKSKR